MKKLTSYQKLKARLAKVEADLREVCSNPDSAKSTMIKYENDLFCEKEKMLMFGSEDYKGVGLIEYINSK